MASGSAWTRSRMAVIPCRPRARTCLSARPSIELRSSGTAGSSRLLVPGRPRGPKPYGHGPGSGLDELVLLKRFVAGDGEVAVLVLAVAAAAQLEPGGDLVDRPAAFRRDRPAGHVDGEVDVPPVAAFPVLDLEYRRVGQNVREVEVFTLPDRG